MKECVKCGIQHEDFSPFCRKCGGPLSIKEDAPRDNNITNDTGSSTAQNGATTKECPSCGTLNLIDVNFCKKCRVPFHRTAPTEKAMDEADDNSSPAEPTIKKPISQKTSPNKKVPVTEKEVPPGAPLPPKPHLLRNIVISISIIACLALVGYIMLPILKGLTPAPSSNADSTAAPTPSPGLAEAVLNITSTPEQAEITVDGAAKGFTPAEIHAPPGEHDLTISKKGYEIKNVHIKINPGEKMDLSYSLDSVKEGIAGSTESSSNSAVKEREIADYLAQGKEHCSAAKYERCLDKMEEVLKRDPNNQEALKYKRIAKENLDRIEKEFEKPEVGRSR